MRALYLPSLVCGEVEVERYDEDGKLMPCPRYKFTADDGAIIYCINYHVFDFKWE